MSIIPNTSFQFRSNCGARRIIDSPVRLIIQSKFGSYIFVKITHFICGINIVTRNKRERTSRGLCSKFYALLYFTHTLRIDLQRDHLHIATHCLYVRKKKEKQQLMAFVQLLLMAAAFVFVSAFNVDIPSALIHRGPNGSYFGFSIDLHKNRGINW